MSNQPNHTSGALAVELNHHPLSGIARINTYNARCSACAARRCQRGIAEGSAGRLSVSRHAMRSSTSARMVIPMDLCSANTRTFAGVRPICTIDNPITPCATINTAISQWNARTNAPQPCSLLRSGMRLLRGLPVIRFRAAIELGFDFEPDRHLRAHRFRKGRHAEFGAVQRRMSGKACDGFEAEQGHANTVDGEVDFHRQRHVPQRETAFERAGALAGFRDAVAFEMRDRKLRRIQEIASGHRSVRALVAEVDGGQIDVGHDLRCGPVIRIKPQPPARDCQAPHRIRITVVIGAEQHLRVHGVDAIVERMRADRAGEKQRRDGKHGERTWHGRRDHHRDYLHTDRRHLRAMTRTVAAFAASSRTGPRGKRDMLCALLLAGALASAATPDAANVPPTPIFRSYGVANGLPSTEVYTVAQDEAGYLWIGTHAGLVRYDSREFKVFRHDAARPDSLPANDVSAVMVDRAGRIWAGGEGTGLNRYEPATNGFVHPVAEAIRCGLEAERSDSLSANDVMAIAEDKAGAVWVGVYAGGLDK